MFNFFDFLSDAVVVQAAKKYTKVHKKLKKKPNNKELLTQKEEIERFFDCGFYKSLTDSNGKFFVDLLKKEDL